MNKLKQKHKVDCKCGICRIDHSRDDPRTGYPTTRRHGHTIREGQPRVRIK